MTTPLSHRRTVAAGGQRGLTLVELMVAITIGLLLLAALTALFVNTSQARRELDRSSELIENGRYAMEYLRDELAHAGFYGPLVSVSGTTDEPCSTDLSKWRDSLTIHVSPSNQDDASGRFNCLAARKAGTDAVFVQRAATCVAGEAGCEGVTAGAVYLQVSGCGEEYSTQPFTAAVAPGEGSPSPFKLKDKNCVETKPAPLRRFLRRIFYVGDGDSLNYVDIGPAGASDPVVVTSGVENVQFEYAIDDNADGSPDTYTSAPTAAQLPNVVGLRLWVLARASERSGVAEQKTFEIGDVVVRPGADDRFKRHVYTSYVTFITPQGRRE